jgi:phage terminase large subunit-like protein
MPSPFAVAADIFDPPPWEPKERPPLEAHQVAPDGRWSMWLLEGGRGCGKTEACSRYFSQYMRQHPGFRGRIIAPTFGDAVEACIEGPSGLLAMDPEIKWRPSAPGGAKVIWPNGSEALVLGTWTKKDVDRLRAGGNRHIDWWEEPAANPQLKRAWDQAAMGLRLGPHPISIAATTPRGTADYRFFRSVSGVARVHATMEQNPHNSPEWVAAMRDRYEGTRIGRQEISGELLEDAEGALWKREWIEANRVEVAAELKRVVTAIDPAVTSGEESDDTGIVTGGKGVDNFGYVLADRTCHVSPDAWAREAIRANEDFDGDKIIGEANNGGDLIETVLRTVDKSVSYKKVHASRGKRTRAEPISALYEQDKVRHVGFFPKLEDEMCQWVPDEDPKSPNRVDALVWAFTELMLKGGDATISGQAARIPGTSHPSGNADWQVARTRRIRGR